MFSVRLAMILIMPLLSGMAAERMGTPDRATIDHPEGGPPMPAEIDLGTQLFFDQRLSGNQTQSCATCHNPDLGMGDGMVKRLQGVAGCRDQFAKVYGASGISAESTAARPPSRAP